MSQYEFFTSCLKTAQDKYTELVNTPRARAGNLIDELKDIARQIEVAANFDEITPEQAIFLKKEFGKIDFSNLARDRAATKEREKLNVGFRFNH